MVFTRGVLKVLCRVLWIVGIICLIAFSLLSNGNFLRLRKMVNSEGMSGCGCSSLGASIFFDRRKDMESCCSQAKYVSLEKVMDLSSQCTVPFLIRTKAGNIKCSCTDVILCRTTIVSALSDNHYPEAVDFIASLQTFMPVSRIIVYNLGLTLHRVNLLNTYCNVEVRNFNFSKYPPHVKKITTFAWKPIIINEISNNNSHEVIMWCDSSCRLRRPLGPLLTHLAKHPILPGPISTFPFIATAHDGMLQYLKINQSRKELASTGLSLQAGAVILWNNDEVKNKVLKYWVDCAMHKECIAPDGATLGNCFFRHMSSGEYCGCHRYDQSAFNLILTREYGIHFIPKIIYDDTVNYWTIERKPTRYFPIATKCAKE